MGDRALRAWPAAVALLGATAAAMVLVHLALMAPAHGGHGSLAVLTVVEILVVAGVWYALRHRSPEQEQS